MTTAIWASFALASLLVLVVPGPTIIMVVSQAAVHGRKSVVPLVAGVLLGDFTAMTLSLLGLGALMSTSEALFTMLKWGGALYLAYLGVSLWRRNPTLASDPLADKGSPPRSLTRGSFIVTALNPKSIAFFVAFFPQFIQPNQPQLRQFLLLGATFLSLAVVNATLYALFAGQLRGLMQKETIRMWLNRLAGLAMVGAGVVTAVQ